MYIFKIYYIINYTLVKIINNFNFLIIRVVKVMLKKVKHQIFEDRECNKLLPPSTFLMRICQNDFSIIHTS
jgi:high-affinity nickel permease